MLEQGSLFGQGENEELLRVHLSASTFLRNKTVDTYLCWRDAFQHTVLLGKKLPPDLMRVLGFKADGRITSLTSCKSAFSHTRTVKVGKEGSHT